MSGHTPGPWRVSSVSPPRVLAADARQTIICSALGSASNESVMADMRLISAAPEMYELLQLWQDQGGRNDERAFDVGQAADQTRALLARIDGPDRSPAAAERDDGEAE